MSHNPAAVDRLCARLLAGDMAALARAISTAERHDPVADALHRSIRSRTGAAEVIGITGPPGSGKSTLINALIAELRREGKRVAVVAVDPSSPLSGGAVLGDRARMGAHTDDPGVFIRSVSARGHLGGLSVSVFRMVDLIDAAGWDSIILETVGAGQSETEIAEVADISVVVNAPGLGDEVQAIKAGILEIADVLVVNKADSPLARHTEQQLRAMLKLRPEGAQDVPVISTVATAPSGMAELLSTVRGQSRRRYRSNRHERLLERSRRLIAQEAAERVRSWVLATREDEARRWIAAVARGDCDCDRAIVELLNAYDGEERP